MKPINSIASAVSLTLAFSAQAGVVSLTPGDINATDTNTAEYVDANVTMKPFIGGVQNTFNANANLLGIDNAGTNNNAFNDPDVDPNNGNEETLEMEFAANAGLTQLQWNYSRANGAGSQSGVLISGFSSDPVATFGTAGVTGNTVTYSNGVLTLKVNYFNNVVGSLNLANPAASAGQTLVIKVGDEDQAGAQLAISGISYEDAVPTQAPVFDTGLPATLAPGIGVSTTLSVVLQPGTAPGPTYTWEYDNGGGFTTVGNGLTYTFLAGPATNGTYRVTVDNGVGSPAISSTVVTAIDDGDGIDNQWEVDNFGDFLTYADEDVEPDGLTNSQEFAAGTDPNVADSDNDGLIDGDEATNGADPLVADTDEDGYGDGYEVNTAMTLPNDAASSPGIDAGRNSIGITFTAAGGQNPNVSLGPNVIAGAPGFGQKNWNSTIPIANAPASLTETTIGTPVAGTLVDSSGASTDTFFTIDTAGVFSVVNNPLQPVGGLYSGYIFSDGTNNVHVDIDNIPYERYDVIVYPLGFNGNQQGTLEDLTSGGTGIQYAVRAPALVANGADPVWYQSSDQTNASNGTFENFPRTSHLIFRGFENPRVELELIRTLDNLGIAAIQIVEDPDSDGDGMGDNYELSVGLDPNNDGTTPVDPKEGANGDFDNDGLSNIDEHNAGTNPTSDDTDNDGFTDDVETDTGVWVSASDTGTDPRIADFDGDGLLDGVETNTGVFVDASNTGTNPLVANFDTDQDGWSDAYEANTGLTNPFDPESPGGPNPNGFAIAFDSAAGVSPATVFGPLVYAGAPGVEQKNWNRTQDLANTVVDASGDKTKIATPVAGEIVDSSGNTLSGVGLTFTAGRGAWSSGPSPDTPYGRLFNSFIYGNNTTDPNANVTITGIPYSSYDVYVYVGSETNGRNGSLTSTSAGTTFSFETQAVTASPGSFIETTVDTGNPIANYAVFRGQTSSTFDVTSTVAAAQNSLGIYGVQIVESTAGSVLSLSNPQISGATFTADFTTSAAGTFILERSTNLQNPCSPTGSPINVASPGTQQVTDPAAPSGKAFYRVREQ